MFLGSGIGASRTDVDAGAVGDELVAGAVAALGADEEDVLEGEVLHKALAHGQVELELAAGPGGGEADVLQVLVDDEASQAEDARVVAADVGGGRVTDVDGAE